MIQDIGEGRFHNEYRQKPPKQDSRIICCRNGEVLMREENERISFPTVREAEESGYGNTDRMTYLFSLDDTTYYLPQEEEAAHLLESKKELHLIWRKIRTFRNALPRETAFAGITGYQLAEWYAARKFCPRCGKKLVPDEKERMMRCNSCGLTEYPKISPAVIVGVIRDDKILMTKYAGREYANYALIAGFTEIGETVEETVRREVLEEVGLKVKNIRYYKSQPWPFSSTLLMGFFCDVDGDTHITLDEEELSLGAWYTKEEIPEADGLSLTNEMMQVFKNGMVPPVSAREF